MRKKLFEFIVTICLIIPCAFMLTSCEDKTLDVAYIQYLTIDDEVVAYTSYSSGAYTHIYLFESEEIKESGPWDTNYLLTITFKRNNGVDYSIDEEPALCVDIEKWESMQISVSNEYYSSSKKVYLNGEDITSKADPEVSKAPEETTFSSMTVWTNGIYYFEDFGLVKGNKSNFINTIEYR